MQFENIMIDLQKTQYLLTHAFPKSEKFKGLEFLNWEYYGSPSGQVIQTNLDVSDTRVGHYAVIPQRWSINGIQIKVGLSLNTAISQNYRMKGNFTDLAERTFESARESGIDAIIGVANQNSTAGFVNRLGFTLLGSLETRILMRVVDKCSSKVKSISKPQFLTWFEDRENNFQNEPGLKRLWDSAEINWRISSPGLEVSYFLFDESMVISTVSMYKGIPVSIILKVLTLSQNQRVNMRHVATATCRLHNTFFAIHSGFNSHVINSGIPLPKRLLPSPLNLIVKPLTQLAKEQLSRPTTFEFLDFDAY